MTEKTVTLGHKAAFCIGIVGWVLGDRLLATFSLFFFVPPDTAELPSRLPAWTVLGVITVWGVISVFGRVVDGVVDPLIASMSDKSRHPFGRRRIFMAFGIVPLAACTALVFFPLDDGPTWGNAIFVAVVLSAYFIAFTAYANPLQALLVDLGRTPKERLDLATVQAAAMLVGSGIVMVGAFSLVGVLKVDDASGPGGQEFAYQGTAVAIAVLSFLFMLAPLIGIPESRLGLPPGDKPPGLVDSLKQTLTAEGMPRALVGNISFWFSFNAIASGVPYIVTVLMKREVEFAGTVLIVTFVVTAISFPVWNLIAKKLGNERTVLIGAVMMGAVMLAVPLIDGTISGLIIMGLGGAPIGVIMALPNAIISDLADLDASKTGVRREAMFFGAQAFFLKVNIGISTAVLAALLGVGKSIDNPLGVQLVGPVTAVVLLLTIFAYRKPLVKREKAS